MHNTPHQGAIEASDRGDTWPLYVRSRGLTQTARRTIWTKRRHAIEPHPHRIRGSSSKPMRGARICYPRVPRLMREDHRRISPRCVTNRDSSCTISLDHTRYKTLPAHTPDGPTRYKTLPARLARRPTRYKTLPASPKTPISAHFSHAGRTLYRFRHQHDKQGEQFRAPTPHRTPTTCPSPKFACNSIE